MNATTRLSCGLLLGAMLSACSSTPTQAPAATQMIEPQRVTEHRGSDDLLTAGLGLAGLRGMAPPAFADANQPTSQELRRRAIWNNWRGIADLSASGGYGEVYGSTANVPGREYAALATLPGAQQPHRVLVQVPDDFDAGKRCIVVTASSGSRGIYGSIAVAGAWGLPRGCAVAYTDKGAGSDYVDLDTRTGNREDGTLAPLFEGGLAFAPELPDAAGSGVAFKHAHSRDNPEADWGRHVKRAAEFALAALDRAFPQAAPFRFDNTRVIAVGVSNGGAAVLRASELDDAGGPGWLDAVVAGEPNILASAPGARSAFDFGTEAALLMPCALLHLPADSLPQPPLRAQVEPLWTARCASLKSAGLVSGDNARAQAASAYEQLKAGGWTDQALTAGVLSVGFDLWRAVAVTYASAYGRYGVGEHPCGYAFSAQNADFSPRATTAAERAAWWSDGSGIPPGSGVGIVDTRLAPPDVTLPGLQCLRALQTGDGEDARRVQAGLAQTRASVATARRPVIVIHGLDDGLIPAAFSSAPYVEQARAGNPDLRYWQVRNAQHFDGFLALPAYGARYVPLLPYMYAALDQIDAVLDGKRTLPADAVIDARPRGTGSVDAAQFAMPR